MSKNQATMQSVANMMLSTLVDKLEQQGCTSMSDTEGWTIGVDVDVFPVDEFNPVAMYSVMHRLAVNWHMFYSRDTVEVEMFDAWPPDRQAAWLDLVHGSALMDLHEYLLKQADAFKVFAAQLSLAAGKGAPA